MKIINFLILVSLIFFSANVMAQLKDVTIHSDKGLRFTKDSDETRIDYYKNAGNDSLSHLLIKVDYDGQDYPNDNIVITTFGQMVIGSEGLCDDFVLPSVEGGPESDHIRLFIEDGMAGQAGSATWTIFSDQRLKTNIEPLRNSLDILKEVNLYSYEYNGKANTPKGKLFYGVMAQEMQEVLPNTVKPVGANLDGRVQDVLTFNANDLFFVGLNATKELALELEEKDRALATAEMKIDGLEERLAEVEEQLTILIQMQSSVDAKSDVKPSSASSSRLMQSIPNPTKGNTIIPYYVPDSALSADLIINDLSGRVLASYDIENRGNGQLLVDFSDWSLEVEPLTYSLIVDGIKVETKKMVFTK